MKKKKGPHLIAILEKLKKKKKISTYLIMHH